MGGTNLKLAFSRSKILLHFEIIELGTIIIILTGLNNYLVWIRFDNKFIM